MGRAGRFAPSRMDRPKPFIGYPARHRVFASSRVSRGRFPAPGLPAPTRGLRTRPRETARGAPFRTRAFGPFWVFPKNRGGRGDGPLLAPNTGNRRRPGRVPRPSVLGPLAAPARLPRGGRGAQRRRCALGLPRRGSAPPRGSAPGPAGVAATVVGASGASRPPRGATQRGIHGRTSDRREGPLRGLRRAGRGHNQGQKRDVRDVSRTCPMLLGPREHGPKYLKGIIGGCHHHDASN